MTYRELFFKANRLVDEGEITLGEYDEMTKPLDRDVECLDKIRAEIEKHRRKTQGIDPYDLIGDCLDIIDKYKEESEE